MAGTFTERIEELRRMTGAPDPLTGTLIVDQLYAHYQHERLDLKHPRGGMAKFLQRPLMARYPGYLDDYARTVLTDGGQAAMRRSMDDLSDQVKVLAPVEFGDLRRSGHPHVTQRGTLYDRPPEVPRLSEAALRAKSRLLWPSLPDALKGWIYWHNTARGKAGLPPPRARRGGRRS